MLLVFLLKWLFSKFENLNFLLYLGCIIEKVQSTLYSALCYVMLCYAMLCYVMLCYVMLCYVMLCYVMLCYVMLCYYTSKKSWRGYIFTAVCLCVCMCVSVCVSGTSCEQNSSRTNESIWTQFSLNGCLALWLGLY